MKDITLDQEIKKDKQKRINEKKNASKKTKEIRRPKFIRRRRQENPRPFRRPPIQREQRLPPRQTQKPSNYNDRKLKVMGIHPDITSEDLYKLFSEQGALQVCRVDQDNFGRSQTTATVIYYSAQNAQQAISNLNKHKIMNSIITVEKWKKQVKALPEERPYNQQNTNRRFNRNRNSNIRSNERGGFRKRFNKKFNRRQR